jgi:hypothetical protein
MEGKNVPGLIDGSRRDALLMFAAVLESKRTPAAILGEDI